MPDTTSHRAPRAGAELVAERGPHAARARAATRLAALALCLSSVPACSRPVLASMRDEARFLPDDPTLQRLETSLREARHSTLAGHSLVDREPTERQEIRVYCDTSGLHLLNQGSALYHCFVTSPAPRPESGWRYERLLDRTRLWRRQLRATPRPLEDTARPGTAILARVEARDAERELLEWLEADLGWLPDLRPRVLLGIESMQWEYREPASGDTFVVRIATVHASWWTPGTPPALDRLTSLRAVAEAPLAVSWKELTIEQEGPGPGRALALPRELLETYGLTVVRTREPGYRRAVSLLCR